MRSCPIRRDLLIDRHRADENRAAQRVILVPGLDRTLHAIPGKYVLVGVSDDASFERDQRVRYLEGRSRQLGLARTLLVARHDQIVLDLVADERPGRAEVGEALC